MQDSTIAETVPYDSIYPDPQQAMDEDVKDHILNNTEDTGTHFLVDKTEPTEPEHNINVRSDLLEYETRSNGSVSCNLCGKVLASRAHWYRHKYRVHVMLPVNPAPLFQCEQCLVYFKSRKGYIGHIASRHSETLQDVSPVLTNEQAEALARESEAKKEKNQQQLSFEQMITETPSDPVHPEVKKEPDPELAIPKSIVPTNSNSSHRQTVNKSTETTRRTRSKSKENPNDRDSEEKRSREEKLVADIIARVRRECEAQGSGGPARRGYTRKSALHT